MSVKKRKGEPKAPTLLLEVVEAFSRAHASGLLLLDAQEAGAVQVEVHPNGIAEVWMPALRGPLGAASLDLLKARFGAGLILNPAEDE